MFPASYQTVGYVPAGTADRPTRRTIRNCSTKRKTITGSSSTPAAAWRTPTRSWPVRRSGRRSRPRPARSPQCRTDLEATTEVSLTAEIYSQAGAAFGLGDGLSNTVVLDQTFNDVDLVGRPLTIGNFVSSISVGAFVFPSTTNTYTPYIVIGDEALPDSNCPRRSSGRLPGSADELPAGQPDPHRACS